jgi:ubiquinone biosynthesis protein
MPRNLNLMLRRLSTGTFTLKIEESNIQKVQMALDKASDKVLLGLVVASLVVGSSLVLLSHPLQLPDSIYWIAIFGYTLAVLVGFYAVYHVIFLKFHGGR